MCGLQAESIITINLLAIIFLVSVDLVFASERASAARPGGGACGWRGWCGGCSPWKWEAKSGTKPDKHLFLFFWWEGGARGGWVGGGGDDLCSCGELD